MIFLTEHKTDKSIDTPRIIANSWQQAQSVCPNHLTVIGVFIKEIEINDINLN